MQSFAWMCTKGGDTVDAIIAALVSGIVTLAEKIPVIEEQIKVANHRIDDLEHINQLKGEKP